MTISDFRDSMSGATPPPDMLPALQALWWVGKGDWDQAHLCVQRHEGDPECDLVHAHLHRQEGDMENAAYWYRRAGRTPPALSLPEEWEVIAMALLSRG